MASVKSGQVECWPEDPVAGVCVHFTSLPSPIGIGDIGDASLRFIDQLALMKLRVWQVLPVGPTSFGDSPYQTLSTFAGNELLIGLEPLVRQGLIEEEALEPLRRLPFETVEFESVAPLKRALLESAAEKFLAGGSSGSMEAYRVFCEQTGHAWLDDYALFRALKTFHKEKAWTDWAPGLARRDKDAIERAKASLREAMEKHRVIQFFFDQQWQALRKHAADNKITLLGDIPFYIAHDSSDAWANPELLMMDQLGQPSQVAGVPPDYFSEDGQLWGNPVYNWKSQAQDGYQWWIRRLARTAALHDLVRIDHFRGFESFWSVPRGETTARTGAWKPGPGTDFFTVVKKSLGALPIVAEDLGLITPEVTRLRQQQGFPGMKVLQFELLDPEFDISDIPENCVCYSGTHDNDTTVGWFAGQGVEKQRPNEIRRLQRRALRHTGGTAGTIHLDLIRLALSSRARMVVIPLQDFLGLGSEARMNTPGTADGNWRWRVTTNQLSSALQNQVATLVEEFSRV